MKILENIRDGRCSVAQILTGLLAAIVCVAGTWDAPIHGGHRRCVVSAPCPVLPPNFEAISPAEFHVASNRQVVRADLELRSTSRCRLDLGVLCCGEWICGLVPSWTVEFPTDGEGPIVPESVKLDLSSLSGNRICPGMKSCPVPIEFRLKKEVTEGDRQTFRLKFALKDPRTGVVQSVDWAVDVVIRKAGMPLLISEKIPFPSEGK